MKEYLPLLIAGAIIGTFSVIFIVAYALMKNKKEAIGFDRNIPDSEIVRRLLKYAKPYWKNFVLVLMVMLFSISYDIISPLLIADIQSIIKSETGFALSDLYVRVAIYASILLISLVSTYTQSIVLQKTGQKIISNIREDLFKHIEQLSHEQLHQIPVGKLVTRVTNDTNGVSMMFTNIILLNISSRR